MLFSSQFCEKMLKGEDMFFQTKSFGELTTKELYSLLQLRAEIFVVEQNCVYQDLDGLDERSIHLLGYEDRSLLAYLRMYEMNPGLIKISRVLSRTHGQGHGGLLLYEALKLIRDGKLTLFEHPIERVFVEAQCYASGFYEREGFRKSGTEFLEDGIPHIGMYLSLE